MDTAIALFTRDLRLHDNPAVHQASVRPRQVVPLFVLDPAVSAPSNRARFLAESLADLLADGDVANNAGNWQWVAGTGNNTRPSGSGWGTRARWWSWPDRVLRRTGASARCR